MPEALMVPPGSVTDTTAEDRWTPVQVTMTLTEPIVTNHLREIHLDGPAQWAAWQHAVSRGLRLPPIVDWAHDFHLPMATWTAPCTRPDPDPRLLAADGVSMWGWACSAAVAEVAGQTTAHVRRRPPTDELAYWTGDRRHHVALGPRRAANVAHQAVRVAALRWWVLAAPDELEALLCAHLTHLGRLARHGWGRIAAITVTPAAAGDRDRWRQRLWPDSTGAPHPLRAPYWHHSRRMPCSWTPPD